MNPADIIKKQAEAVTGFNKLTAAEHLEAAAKLLRQEAAQEKNPVKGMMAEIKKKKESRIERIGAAMKTVKKQQVEQAFAGSDWVKFKENEEKAVYCRKGKQGMYINIVGDQFSVTSGDVTGSLMSVSMLAGFVVAEKKERG